MTTTTQTYDMDAAFQELDRSYVAGLRQRQYPKTMSKETLLAKITAACKEIGITDIVFKEYSFDDFRSNFTHGCIRQQQHDKTAWTDSQHDILYLRDNSEHPKPSYHTDIVRVNADIFSHQKEEEFYKALQKQGLSPSTYTYPCAPLFATPEMIETEKNRDKEALYR